MGRRLSEAAVTQMYNDYLRLRSLTAVGKKYGRTGQSIWELFHKRGLDTCKQCGEVLVRNGVRFLRDQDGYWRATSGKRPGLNRVVWEEAHGPVPAGFEVCFKDGNKDNCALENLELRKRFATGLRRRWDIHAKQDFAEEMVVQHKGFVVQLAEKYARAFEVPIEDLIQCGRIGVVKAARTYQGDKGANFLTWAKFSIRREMQEFARLNARIMYRPLARLWEGEDVSMEAQIAEGFRLEDLLGVEERITGDLIDREEWGALHAAMGILDPKVQEILRLRFFEETTLEEIAARYGVTRQAIQCRVERALRKMREELKEFREAA